MARLGTRQYNYGYNTKNQLSEIGTPATAPVATNFGLLNCNDYALLADLEGVVVNPPATGTPPASGTGVTLTLSPSALPNGVFDILYNQTLSVSGGTSPYTFAVTSGTLPLGLSLTGNKIFGQPQAIEVAVFTITSTDSLGNTGSRNYELGIDGAGGGGGARKLPGRDSGYQKMHMIAHQCVCMQLYVF